MASGKKLYFGQEIPLCGNTEVCKGVTRMENEKRLIDINKFPLLPSRLDGDMSEYERGYLDAQENMNLLPTVDAVEVVHGRWVSDKADILFHCSECETQISTDWDYDDLIWNYCPNCGAKMDGGEDNDR
jgi:hypothetical protein